ncbi:MULTISPECIES: hypothetical protein [Pseudanabaena]|uniref:Uncharacterized protein n=2 Tax=Pseudanabaena TaxID=1152 RepID=L8MXJ5_9CYAN|nr:MULTISPECIES: hypothetical protein [Pseudanabaena]ELS30708.1 hypothetical protein Pse7429DRAFT_4196 [Pseudanabaena biceps PCC 7429]MDG3497026.1 hypothetical protein [Pseudanabaena catenata USMAC16]
MNLVSLLFLYFIGIVSTGCTTNSPLAVTPQASILTEKTQAKPKTTNQNVEAATDTQKPILKVGDISELKDDKTCDDVGEIIVYAETQNYLAYICANNNNVSQPKIFKVKLRESKTVLFEGDVLLSWDKHSLVGIVQGNIFKLNIPSNAFLKSYTGGCYADKQPALCLYGQIFESAKTEKIIRFLRSQQFTSKSDEVISKALNQRILQSLYKKGKQLSKRCRAFEHQEFDPDQYSHIFLVSPQTYLVALYCGSNTKNPEYIYWLTNLKGDTLESVPFLLPIDRPEFSRTPEYQLDGHPSYDSELGILSIYKAFGTNGSIIKYKINGSKVKLIEERVCEDRRCLDPVFFSQYYP